MDDQQHPIEHQASGYSTSAWMQPQTG